MNPIFKKELYIEVLDAWGMKSQFGMVQEECAELIVAINKLSRANDDSQRDLAILNIADELADVEIMVEQIKVWLEQKEYNVFDRIKEAKLRRLNERLLEVQNG